MKYTTPQFELNYTEKGNQNADRTLVFLNGVFHGEPSWIKQSRYPFFKKQHRQLFIDYPGCGESKTFQPFTYDDLCHAIADLISELKLPNVTIVGYSFGGILALELAKRFPARIQQLVLVNSGLDISARGKKMMASVQHMMETDVALSTIFLSIYPWFFSDQYVQQLSEFQPVVVQRYVEYNHSKEAVLGFLDTISRRTLSDADSLKAPALLVGTEGDIICPPDQQKALVDSHSGFQWECLPIHTHAANIESHSTVNQIIQGFLESHYD
ncbi:alpha/beta fold hydrolase [Vibrio nigripulchritudo]|uniref:alpha/beta fold hydrolase n=1 Tax=Vibrio nigripulchritudo TaxID=28173 RepID=UPI002491A2D0|nr:alpha/beta hydrolase [Vibrio nigripulchritudo]BDU37683.1 lipolytic protein [Vibrio nigripulchritudo]BDU43403.1 lipolytic protein [Vibrio nigripulchritudo]